MRMFMKQIWQQKRMKFGKYRLPQKKYIRNSTENVILLRKRGKVLLGTVFAYTGMEKIMWKI